MRQISATISICTRNRADSLRQCLERLTQLNVPPNVRWDVLVVDNGSTDSTQAVLSEFRGRLPLRSVHEQKKGVSNARSRAVEETESEYMLWIDDDVLVGADYLATYARAFEQFPEASIFGGAVRPKFEGAPPAWLLRALPDVSSVYCLIDLGHDPIRFDPNGPVIPLGSNYAVKRRAYGRLRYDPNFGYGSETAPLGEETVLIRKILSQGHEGVWVPDAPVEHVIPPERQTTHYLRRYYAGYGKTLAYLATQENRAGWATLFGMPRWAVRGAVTNAFLYIATRYLAPPEVWCRYLVNAATCYGQITGWKSRRGAANAILVWCAPIVVFTRMCVFDQNTIC